MARIARVVLPDQPHHVTQRGNRRQRTFFNDDDYQEYVWQLSEACRRHGTQVWAWCLMPNHVHLVLVPQTEDGLHAPIAEAHRRSTRHVNFREGWRGHLWQEPFHSFPMDESYLLATVRYVELNPVKAGLVRRPEEWPWSSARTRLGRSSDALNTLNPLQQFIDNWQEFWNSGSEECSEWIELHSRTGRPLGSEAFMRVAERKLEGGVRPRKPGPKPERRSIDHQGKLPV